MPTSRRLSGWDAAVVAVSMAGAVTMLVCLPHGVGVYPDSVQYIAAARRLLEGHGLQGLSAAGDWTPLTRFPPLYPLVLALASWVSRTDPLVAARWVHVFFWGVNIFLGARLIRTVVADAAWAPLAGALALACCPALIRLHSLALSEPLFMTLVLLALHWLTRPASSANLKPYGVLSLLCAAAVMTRYVGVAMLLTATVMVAVRAGERVSTATRVRRAFCMALASITQVGLWMLWMHDGQGMPAGRSLHFHPPDWRSAQQFVASVWGWAFAWELPAGLLHGMAIRMPLALAVVALLIVLVWRRRRLRLKVSAGSLRPEAALVLFLVSYMASLAAARTFADAAIDFDDRMLMPLLFLGILLAVRGCAGCGKAGCGTPTGLMRRMPLLLLTVWIVSCAVRTGVWIVQVRRDGQGLAGTSWRELALLNRLRTADSSVRHVSNVPDAVYLWLDRPAALLPVIQDPVSGERNPDFEAELSALCRQAQNAQVCIVLFDEAGWRWYLPSPEDLLSYWRDAGIAEERCADGTLLGACAKP